MAGVSRRASGAAVSVLVTVVALGCGTADRGAGPTAPEADQAPAAAAEGGEVAAQPEAGDPTTRFEARTAALGTSFFGVHVLLADLEHHPVGDNGKWNLLAGDLQPPYHRLAMTIEALPDAPGEVAVTRLEYSLHDADAGPFNYGWTSLEGGITVDEVAGAIEVKEGQVTTVRLRGSFDVTNNKGGRFTGTFDIVPAG